MIAVLGLVVGVLVGLIVQPTVPVELQPYLPIAVVAALDALFGGLRALLDGTFDDRVFLTSFLSNVLGIRIFSNAAAIRRHLFRA